MKKTNFFQSLMLVLFLLMLAPVNAQDYIWKHGANVILQPGKYGTPGLAAPANVPGARNAPSQWTDAAGKFWLFGGFGVDKSTYGELNDLWKYDPLTNNWTFIKGDSVGGKAGIYGTLGVSSPANKPGSRYMAASWIDQSGNFWLFGGNGTDGANAQGFINDLWKYNPTTNEWTWVKGGNVINQIGVYGTLGTAAAGNVPGAREGALAWADNAGHLFLFSGFGYESTGNVGMLNDLWMYTIASNQWTWVKGSNMYDKNGTYGTKGSAATANTPGGRRYATGWKDASGKFWVLGGYGLPATGALMGHMNDLWQYDPATNQWTWMNGSVNYDQVGVYGTKGVPAPSNLPGSRVGGYSWTDTNGDLWLFGGYAMGISTVVDYSNDLWQYKISTNTWTWIKGGNTFSQAGVYGTQGVPSSLNTPGGRTLGASWLDSGGSIWLFGGDGYDTNSQTSSGVLNDLWKFGSCTVQTLTIAGPPLSICAGSTVVLTASGANSFLWNNLQTTPSISVSPQTNTSYTVTSTDANGCNNSAAYTVSVTICSGITANGQAQESMLISPNPSSGDFTVSWQNGAASYKAKIYNSLGQHVLALDELTNGSAINTGLPAGVYILEVYSENGISKKKFLIE